jgi:hypothetical protein
MLSFVRQGERAIERSGVGKRERGRERESEREREIEREMNNNNHKKTEQQPTRGMS